MSVRVMALVFDAEISDLEYTKGNEARKAKASTVKLMLLAYADHANDEGEAAYPGYTRLELKTALSRQGIADTLDAITQNGLMTMTGKSKLDTNSYQINLEKLQSLVKSPGNKKTALVKPLDSRESSHLTATSQATGLKPSLPSFNHPIDAQSAPSASPLPGKKGDMMDGILHFAGVAAQKSAIEARLPEYPPDVQDTLKALAELWGWPEIPARPARGGKGGAYAQWILELRDINGLISGYGREALEAAHRSWKKSGFTVAHPGALTKTIFAAVGELNQRKGSAKPAGDKPWWLDTGLYDEDGNLRPVSPRPPMPAELQARLTRHAGAG